jgi:cytochrome c
MTWRSLATVLLGNVAVAVAQFTTPDCPNVAENEFKLVKVVSRAPASDPTLQELTKMDFVMQANGKVDIYFIERSGKLKRYDATANKVSVAGQLVVNIEREQGLVGLALDPRFKQNHQVYLFYCPKNPSAFRISRFTLANGILNMASEKVLLTIPIGSVETKHTGGGMAFDSSGNLWIATGSNHYGEPHVVDEAEWEWSVEGSSANLGSLRGAILRIHPDGSPKGYSVPKGNFGEYWSAQFAAQGKAEVAREYADTSLVKPEIYVKGVRNPYSLTVDSYRGWLTWGEFGHKGVMDEHNLTRTPIFGGYPYFGGYQLPILTGEFLAVAGKKDPAAPVNNSRWNTGPRQLPPAIPALHANDKQGGITGPIYYYDGDSPSPVKFPPHFDKAWFVTDYSNPGITILRLNETGDKVLGESSWFRSFGFNQALDFKLGPDGALYVLTRGGSAPTGMAISRIEYTGNCRPSLPKLPKPPTSLSPAPAAWGRPRIQGGRLEWNYPGSFDITILDAAGRTLFRFSGKGPVSRSLPGPVRAQGLIVAHVRAGSTSWSMLAFQASGQIPRETHE